MAKKIRKQTINEKKKMEQLKKRESLKSMHFNRFLMVRYILALFFFANFAWTVLAWGGFAGVLGLILTVLGIFPMWESGKMYGNTNPSYTWIRIYFTIQMVVCAGMLILSFTAPFTALYPFFADNTPAHVLGLGIPALGLLLAYLVLRRLKKIDTDSDKQFQRIQFFETKYKMHL